MMLPVLLRAGEEALRLAPHALKEASYALGANRLQTMLRVTIPAVFPALLTAIFLAISRVAGETAPLLFTAANSRFWPSSLADFMPSLPVYIFNYSISPYEEWHQQAWAGALVLLTVVMLLNFGTRQLTRRRSGTLRVSAD
ncbi:MAG: ABC transporter permease subunit [Proteobacteria bacterium]|nr:ABC transporter permease subunit [Pseudomonadota bacterium]